MTRIFVSYARVDIYLVRQLVGILEAGGHQPWFDHRLIPGQDWKAQLLDGIRSCDAFVYTLTPESVASEWCQWEFARAIEMGKPIVPVLFQDNTDLPDLLSRYQYVDFTEGPTPESAARLMNGLWNLAVRIPAHQAPKKPVKPRGLPSRAPEEIIATFPEMPVPKIQPPPLDATRPARASYLDQTRERVLRHGRRWGRLIMGGLLALALTMAAALYIIFNGEHPEAAAATKQTPSLDVRTATHPAEPTATPIVTAEACPGGQPSRLKNGDIAWIPLQMGSSFKLQVRSAPGLTGPTLTRLYSGMVFHVIGGPVCSDWMTWWQIRRDDNGIEGWAAESDRDGYFMKPVD